MDISVDLMDPLSHCFIKESKLKGIPWEIHNFSVLMFGDQFLSRSSRRLCHLINIALVLSN